jgi:preprotein translocase subunit SecA
MIDEAWKEHLRELDDLKQSVQSATYEQKDPLLIYKFESFNLFKTMVQKINNDVVSFLVKGNLPVQDPETVKEAQAPRGIDQSRLKEERTDLLSQAHSDTQGQRKTAPVKRTEKKYGRNDKVKVQYNDGRVLEKKYKIIEHDLKRGECRIV